MFKLGPLPRSALSQHQVLFFVAGSEIIASPFRKFIGFWCKSRDVGRWKPEKLLQWERDVEVGSWKDPGWKVGGLESDAQPHEATQQPEPPSPLDS